MMNYDEYMAKFDSDPEDDDDPVIKQLKYNALFAEEDGFIIVLPGFKPYRVQIQPVPEPPKLPHYMVDNGLEQHDRIVGSMKAMTLAMSGKNYHSSETLSAPQSPRHYARKPQRSRASSRISETSNSSSKHSDTCKYSKQQEKYEKRHINDYNNYNNKISGKGNNNMKQATKITPRHENIMNVANEKKDVD